MVLVRCYGDATKWEDKCVYANNVCKACPMCKQGNDCEAWCHALHVRADLQEFCKDVTSALPDFTVSILEAVRRKPVAEIEDETLILADVAAKAERRGLRCEVDPAGKNCLNKQIRYAEKLRVPIICVVGEQEASSGKLSVRARGRGDLGKIDVDVLLDMLGGVEDVDQLDAGAFEKPDAPPSDASARPAREAPIEESPVPTLLRLDADFTLELARELLRSEL